jgi:uncharacterized protein YqgC (DUF456 family)
MMETLAIVTVAVLVILTIATLFPFVPSGILASATVIAYWWQTGYTEPNILIVFSLVILGVTVTVTDFASGAVAGKLGGASNISVVIGSIIGIVLLFITGPIGFLAGIAISVFLFSVYHEDDEIDIALRKSLYTVIGVLASKVVQFLLLSIITISFAFFIFI